MIEIARIEDPDEVFGISSVIDSAWGMPDIGSAFRDAVKAMRYHGGLVLGAYDASKMIGFSFSFPGYKNGKVYLYSHMTGVRKERKYSGIGLKIKEFQKNWAISNGYDLIAWTFDPVRSLNAYFNIAKVGAISRTHLVNFYGTMDDSLNSGLQSNRIVAEWWIKSERRKPSGDVSLSLQTDAPVREIPDSIHGEVTIEIPLDFDSIVRNSKEEAAKMKHKLSSYLTHLFAHGFVIINVYRDSDSSKYVLSQTEPYIDRSIPRIF